MKRILGLDVGDKTLGVAVSDELGWTAQGVTVRQRSSLAADMSHLRSGERVVLPTGPQL